jgi:hypothetical protein
MDSATSTAIEEDDAFKAFLEEKAKEYVLSEKAVAVGVAEGFHILYSAVACSVACLAVLTAACPSCCLAMVVPFSLSKRYKYVKDD